jgi:hypothetical protein
LTSFYVTINITYETYMWNITQGTYETLPMQHRVSILETWIALMKLIVSNIWNITMQHGYAIIAK